jgi:hypothetical protein
MGESKKESEERQKEFADLQTAKRDLTRQLQESESKLE